MAPARVSRSRIGGRPWRQWRRVSARKPDRLGIRNLVAQPKPEDAHEGQPVVDQDLGPVVGEIVLRLDHQDLEHHDGVERRPPAHGPVAIAERRVQFRAEHLEIDHRGERLQLVADVAQPLKPLVQLE